MLKRASYSVLSLLVFMLHLQLLASDQVAGPSKLPLEQVNAINKIYDIIESDTYPPDFRWNKVVKNSSNPCSWEGVGCSSDNSSINHISFQGFSISTSEFLPFVCNITTLESLDVSYNLISSIPHGFFSGCGNISGLKLLDFSGNYLNGSLPTFKNGFRVLETLDFSRNTFSGEISLQLEGLGSLKYLDLGWNKFEGKIPTNLGKMDLLEELRLISNSFSGEIPLEITKYKNLSVIYLSDNCLSGSIPTAFGDFTNLETLVLCDNHLSGGIPSSLSNITTLQVFSAGYNNLTGMIPSHLLSGPHLQFLALSYNQLEGPIPGINSTTLLGIRFLDLSYNRLTGILPLALGNLTNLLEVLDLRGNNLNGVIPDGLSRLQRLRVLNLQDNNLSGAIPASIRDMYSLQELLLGNNQLNMRIPGMSTLYLLQVLDLQGNNLSGPIPDSITSLSSLVRLHLGSNQLKGEIPDGLSALQTLQVLDLSNNSLSGNIPNSLTRLRNLTLLLLMNNHLSGLVPEFEYSVQVNATGNKDLIPFGENPSPEIPQRRSSSIDPEWLIAAASGFPVGLLISLIAILISRRYKSIRGNLSTPNSIHTPNVDFKKAMEVVADPTNIITKTAFSTFYKFVMPSDTTYLVKKVNHTRYIFQLFPQHKQLVKEMEAFGSLSDPNVMIPVAYVLTLQRAYIFYDFARGTLHDVLHHRRGNKLEWGSRYNIAVGISKGLAYLHECSSGPIILLDLCSKSILLKSLDEPQISDIELCKLIHPSNRGGSAGYVPPEHGCRKRATAAGNVYSFGVILLELLTGKPTVSDEETEISKQVLSSPKWDEIVDSSIISSDTSVGVRTEMAAVVEVALACLSISPEARPNAVTVLQLLRTK